ncbi:MAG: hydroxymethylbilane synthase [Candidatus Omnitrophica bacterium]|nr:hydroxymethylbilane synthase [Candidatus Omnitrophota bacterium]
MKSHLRIGSRGSTLAMYQAVLVQSRLKELYPMITSEIIKIKTKGDMIRRGGLSSIGRGIFTREIEDALLRDEVDLAVHSAKDLETELSKGLAIGAILEREDARDCLVAKKKQKLKELKPGSKIGTSSLRRKAQLKRMRPDLEIVDLRGNVDTRLAKVESGHCSGIILAVAGINRLGRASVVSEIFDPLQFLPQAAQGSIAVEIRESDQEIKGVVKAMNHLPSARCTEAERSFLRTLHGGCQVPIGIASWEEAGTIFLKGGVFSMDGAKALIQQTSGSLEKANELGCSLAKEILAAGGHEILDDIRRALDAK